MSLIQALQRKTSLIVTGPTGIGKSTKFPLTIASLGYNVLVVTPTNIGARTLANYVNNINIDYRQLTDVYLELVNTMLLPDYDYIIIDDIQLAKLEMFLLVAMILSLNKNNTVGLAVAGLQLPESFLTLPNFNPLALDLANINLVNMLPVNLMYSPYDPTFDEAVNLVTIFLDQMWPFIGSNGLGGRVLLIVADQKQADLYGYNLAKFKPITITTDGTNLQQLNQLFDTNLDNPKQLIITTSILEVTVTIPNVEIVIDTMHDNFVKSRPNGRLYYQYSWISQAQAVQRAGRAGRLKLNNNYIGQTGLCYRLCSQATFNSLPQQYPDEITLLPLSTVLLQLLLAGYDSNILPSQWTKLALEQLQLFDLIKIENGEYIVSNKSTTDKINKNNITTIVSKLPLTILAATILANWIELKYDLACGIIYAAIIDVGGPFVNGDVLTSQDINTDLLLTFQGPSDFHLILNLINQTFTFTPKLNNADGFDITIDNLGSKIKFDLLTELAQLVNQIYITLSNINLLNTLPTFKSSGSDIFNDLNLLINLDLLQQLIRHDFGFLICSYNDNQNCYYDSNKDKLYLNRNYPRQRQAIVLAALVTDGTDGIELGLSLD